MRELGGPLLHCGVGKDPVGIPVPFRVKPSPQVLELHLLQPALIQEPGIPGIVVQHLPVPVLLRRPEVVPTAPEAVVSEVHGEQPMEVGQAFFGEEVERQRRAGGIRNARRLGSEVAQMGVGAFIGRGTNQLRREPELPFPLMDLHQLPNPVLEVLKHLDLGVQFPCGVGGDAHELPSATGDE